MQVLKEKNRSNILHAAEQIFYEKDYRSAKLTDIAALISIPVALIYTYFKNKEALFEAVVAPVYQHFFHALQAEEALESGNALERFEETGRAYLCDLLEEHKRFVILFDKSAGTKYHDAKDTMIARLAQHIQIGLSRQTDKKYDAAFPHILACNYTAGLIEIARHYKNREWADEMLDLLHQCYFKGVLSLSDD